MQALWALKISPGRSLAALMVMIGLSCAMSPGGAIAQDSMAGTSTEDQITPAEADTEFAMARRALPGLTFRDCTRVPNLSPTECKDLQRLVNLSFWQLYYFINQARYDPDHHWRFATNFPSAGNISAVDFQNSPSFLKYGYENLPDCLRGVCSQVLYYMNGVNTELSRLFLDSSKLTECVLENVFEIEHMFDAGIGALFVMAKRKELKNCSGLGVVSEAFSVGLRLAEPAGRF